MSFILMWFTLIAGIVSAIHKDWHIAAILFIMAFILAELRSLKTIVTDTLNTTIGTLTAILDGAGVKEDEQ